AKVILSTDDLEIAEVGHRCGLEVPFLRPPELAEDATPMLPVVQHAVRWLEHAGEYFDAVCLLQPTNPLRRPEDIDSCVELLETTQADAVVTLLPVPLKYNPHWVYFVNGNNYLRLCTGEPTPITRRQELPLAFHREGSVYITRRDILIEQDSLYGKRLAGFQLDPDRCVNVDDVEDWERASALISRGMNETLRTNLSVC
ncbi:MAG: cytidylyltransferase domain-containing protein, partial [Pyrinomonadaceae bacterium]